MDIYQYLPQSAEDYIKFVRSLAALLHKAMDQAEGTQFISDREKGRALQRIAEGVETVACLRGDSGMFSSGRPANLTEYQSEMYQIEDSLRTRLMGLGYVYPSR